MAAVRAYPLHELKGYPLGTFEESKSPAAVVHLIAEQFHSVRHQVVGRRTDIVDAERKVVVAVSPQICRVLASKEEGGELGNLEQRAADPIPVHGPSPTHRSPFGRLCSTGNAGS